MSAPIQLTLDPWASDHDGEIAIAAADDAATVPVDTGVETPHWEAVRPPADPSGPLIFVDGVRRVEARILATSAGDRSYGLLGAYAVGALRASVGVPTNEADLDRLEAFLKRFVADGMPDLLHTDVV